MFDDPAQSIYLKRRRIDMMCDVSVPDIFKFKYVRQRRQSKYIKHRGFNGHVLDAVEGPPPVCRRCIWCQEHTHHHIWINGFLWGVNSICSAYVPRFIMLSLTSPQPLVTIGGMSLIEFLTLHASRRLLQPFRKLVVAHETIVDGADYMPKVNRIGAWFHGFMLGLHHSKGLNPQRKNNPKLVLNHLTTHTTTTRVIGLILQNRRNTKCPWLLHPDVGTPLVLVEVPANAVGGDDALCTQ